MRRYIISKHIRSNVEEECYKCNKKFSEQQLNELTNQEQTVYLCDDCYDKYATTCYKCGQIILKEQNELGNSKIYACKDCIGDFQCCDNCGNYFDRQKEGGMIQDVYYCESCFDQLACTCEQCGQIGFYDDMVETYDRRGNSIYVCDNCKNEFITECYLCSQDINIYEPENDGYRFHTGDYICNSCFDRCSWCRGCDQLYQFDDMQQGDDQQWYCPECIDQHKSQSIDPDVDQNDIIYPYSKKITVDKKKIQEQDDTKQYIGVQLQIRNQNKSQKQLDEFVKHASKNKNIIFKRDGSVSSDGNVGVEIVTKPCTYNYHKHEFGWQQIFHYMKEYNMINTSNCGLHFHISRNNFTKDQQKCLDYFVQNATTFLSQIGGRNYAGDQGYFCKAVNKDENEYGNNKFDRYQSVNFQNDDTVQLRFMKSTNSFGQFRKRLGTVHNICKLAKFFTFDDLKTLDETDLKYCFHQIIQNIY